VAENQPVQTKNRMIAELTSFAERLRQNISSGVSVEFNSLALKLFELQYRFNAAYRRICDARGLHPTRVEEWSRIPAVPTAAFKELELTCLSSGQRTAVFHSSGTTGQQPSRHFHSSESRSVYEASLWPWFEKHLLPDRAGGCPPHPKLIALTPPPAAAPHSSLVHMFETIRRQPGVQLDFWGRVDGDGAWELDLESAIEGFQSAAAKNQPVVMLGTAFNFVHLLDGLMEQNLSFHLPSGSGVMETGGYKGRSRELSKPELHELIAERLGILGARIVCEYGMSELSSQAYDGVVGSTQNSERQTRTFQFPPWCRAKIISPETGREVAEGAIGLIRIFDLANVFSVMAVQTEDLGVRRGDGFELLGRAVAAEPRGCSLMAS
jgi:hypothetical protein